MKLGIEILLQDESLMDELKSRRVGLVAHPASVDHKLRHTVDLLHEAGVNFTCLFGPQHGLRGEKQDNMIESDDYLDPELQIPAYSLYGNVRRPTSEMINQFDILIFDLQDVGCRIYTFLTTLFYLIEDLKETDKELWVLDRPNPAGRPVEGHLLQSKFFSFVGAGALTMRHGLTLGEAALWKNSIEDSHCNLKVVAMEDYSLSGPANQWGWPQELAWVNPSPNIPNLTSCRVYSGSVLFEGTHLSEGRGTTRPLEVIGAPFIDPQKLFKYLHDHFSEWVQGAILRPCFFEPTFHKFSGELCGGIQIHTDNVCYDESLFRPYRLSLALLKSIHNLYPEFNLFKTPPYEYEEVNLPIEILSGTQDLKLWVEDPQSQMKQIDASLIQDEKKWLSERQDFLIYEN